MAQAIILLDDIDLAGDPPARNEATVTKRFTVDGREWELDLTAQHGREFEADMAKWTRCAHRPSGPLPVPRKNPGRKPDAYYAGMREMAGKLGIEIPVPADGKYGYPAGLRRQWDRHLEQHPELVTW